MKMNHKSCSSFYSNQGVPVCDVNEQLDFHICAVDCVAKISGKPTGNNYQKSKILLFILVISNHIIQIICLSDPSDYYYVIVVYATFYMRPTFYDVSANYGKVSHTCDYG